MSTGNFSSRDTLPGNLYSLCRVEVHSSAFRNSCLLCLKKKKKKRLTVITDHGAVVVFQTVYGVHTRVQITCNSQ